MFSFSFDTYILSFIIGTQEVIQDIPQNHVLHLEQNDEEDDIRELGTVRVGRRYETLLKLFLHHINYHQFQYRNRDTERIRQSTGNWQRDPNIEWKRNILVPTLKKSILERARQIRYEL